MVVEAQIVEFGMREEVILQEACGEGGVGLAACDAYEGIQGALDVTEGVLVGLGDRVGGLDGDVVLWWWGLELLFYACEGVDGDAVKDGGHDDVFLN